MSNITYRGYELIETSPGLYKVVQDGKTLTTEDLSEEAGYKWIDSTKRHEREFLARGEYRDGNDFKRELE